MSKKKATQKASDPSKAIGVLLADAAVTRKTITDLSVRIAALERLVEDLRCENQAIAIQVRALMTQPPPVPPPDGEYRPWWQVWCKS